MLKDMYGTTGSSSFTVSTNTAGDQLDEINNRVTLSNANATITFASDGAHAWRTLDYYAGGIVTGPVYYLPGLWTKFYTNTGSIPDSNGPPGNTSGTSGSGWGTAITGVFSGGDLANSNIPGVSSRIYYGNNYGYSAGGNANYSGIYTGYIYSAGGGTIQFQFITDDGSRVDFNNSVALISWGGQGATTYTSAVLTLPAGYTPFLMRWYDTGGGGANLLQFSINGAGYTSNGSNVYFYKPANIT